LSIPGLSSHWRKEVKADATNAFPGTGHLKPLEAENLRLRRELAIAQEERDILKKAVAIFSKKPKKSTVYEKVQLRISVERMAKVFEVSRSGYYNWHCRSKSKRAQEQQLFDLEVQSAFMAGKGHYGRDRVLLELGLRGRKASRKRVGASMQRQGLRFKPKRRFRVTTNSKHGFPVAENLLNRNFTVSAPNQVLVSDITYLPAVADGCT